MVVVAVLGAITAHRTATAEHEAAQRERRLAQGHILELTIRQRLIANAVAHRGLERRRETYVSLGNLYGELAGHAAEVANARQAITLGMQAQEEFAAARVVKQSMAALPSHLAIDGDVDTAELEREVADRLADLGYATAWPSEGAGAPHSMWKRLEDEFGDAHAKIPKLALGVVMFVAALVLFTFSDLSRGRRALPLYASGVAVAVLGTAFVLRVDKDTLRWGLDGDLLVIPAVLAILEVAWRKHSRDVTGGDDERPVEPCEVEPSPYRCGHLRPTRAEDRFSRRMLGLIAVTVLFVGVCGWGYSRANSEAAADAGKGLAEEIEVNARSARLALKATDLIQKLAASHEYATRAHAQRQRAEYVKRLGSSGAIAQALSVAKASVAQKLAGAPNVDLRRDAREEALTQHPELNPAEPFARYDAFAQNSVAWHHQAGIFLATLTVLAIALYLFGQADAMGRGRAAYLLAACGASLVLFAVYSALTAHVHRPRARAVADVPACRKLVEDGRLDAKEDPEALAAQAYGRAKLNLQSVEPTGDAIGLLECAVGLRPGFARARFDLAEAYSPRSAGGRGQRFRSPTGATDRAKLVEHQRRALEALEASGYVPPPLRTSHYAFDAVLAARSQQEAGHGLKLIDDALRLHEASGRPDPRVHAAIQLDRALARRAVNRGAEADRAMDEALRTVSQSREPGATARAVLPAALTGLEELATSCLREVASCKPQEIARAKERLVAGWPAGAPPARGARPAVASPRVEVSPAALSWRAALREFNASSDRLVVVWYERDEGWGLWRALPEVSGLVTAAEALRLPDAPVVRDYLSSTRFTRCLGSAADAGGAPASVAYRAEAYVNGRLAATADATLASTGFTASAIVPFEVALCLPQDWSVLPPESDDAFGRVLVDGDGNQVSAVVTLYGPSRPTGADGQRRAATGPAAHADGGAAALDAAYGCERPPPARLVYRTWTSRSGLTHGVVGDTSAAEWQTLCAVLSSATDLEGADESERGAGAPRRVAPSGTPPTGRARALPTGAR